MRALRTVGILVAVQLVLVGLYLGVELLRSEERPFSVEPLDEAAPPLAVAVPDTPHLVHFWATWCGPCREELPSLLAASDAEGVPLLAVTDEPWPVVERYFEGDVPSAIVRDPSAAGAWRVSGLPDTFAVRDGRIVGRMGGARDWSTTDARAFLRDLRRTR